MLRSSVF